MSLPTLRPYYLSQRTTSQQAQQAQSLRRENEHQLRTSWQQKAAQVANSEYVASKKQGWESDASHDHSMQNWQSSIATKEDSAQILLERRIALKQLLEVEREQYMLELKQLRPSGIKRLQDMKERVSDLKTQRETARKQIVDESIAQFVERNNPDIRALESKRLQKYYEDERAEQLKEHEAQRERERVQKAEEIERLKAELAQLEQENKQKEKKRQERKRKSKETWRLKWRN